MIDFIHAQVSVHYVDFGKLNEFVEFNVNRQQKVD